jgi:hypothetical protein
VAEACCGINSQDYLESFSSFWARTEGFSDSDLAAELRPKGGLVRTRTVRNTMHTIPSKDYYVHVLGGPGRRFDRWFDTLAKRRGIPDRDFRMRFLYEPFLDHIKARAVTTKELEEFMIERLIRNGLKGKMKLTRGWSSKPTYGPSWTGMSEMSCLGLLVSAGRGGSESLWMRSADWLTTRQKPPGQEECVVELVRKYIECYGPATLDDIAYWTFLTKKDVNMALNELKLKEETFSDSRYFSTGSDVDAGEPPEVIILPEFDSLMMGYKDKSRFLPHGHLKSVFLNLAMINRTVLLDGFVAATWKRKKIPPGIGVNVRALRTLTARERRSIDDAFTKYGEYRKAEITVDFDD